MTSRISFPKLLKQELRHRSISLIYFLTLLLQFAGLLLGTWNQVMSMKMREGKIEELKSLVIAESEPNFFWGLLALCFGIAAALEGFSYLHSKKKMDFYGTLPVSRLRKYTSVVLSEVLLFFVAALLSAVIQLGIYGVFGLGSKLLCLQLFYTFLCEMAVFIMGYGITTLAVVMTGKLMVSALGAMVFLSYVPIVSVLIGDGYASAFLSTHVLTENGIWEYVSPIYLMGYLLGLEEEGERWSILTQGKWFLPILLIGLVTLGIAAWLYRIRASERAGDAMAFPKFNGILQCLLVIPAALVVGLIFAMVAGFAPGIWVIVGTLFGVVIGFAIVEGIISQGLRNWKRHIGYLAFSIVACMGILAIYLFDLTGYDTYVPKAQNVKAVLLDEYPNLLETGNLESSMMRKIAPMDEETIEQAIAFVEEAVLQNQEKNKGIKKGFWELQVTSEEEEERELEVVYITKKNGLIRRRYAVTEEMLRQTLESYYKSPSYRNSLLSMTKDNMKRVTSGCINTVFGEEIKLTKEQLEKIYKAYEDDYRQMTTEEYQAGISIASIMCMDENEYSVQVLDIGPKFTNTLEAIKDCGIILLDAKDYIWSEMEIEVWKEDGDFWETYEVTDPKVLAEYQDQCIIGWKSDWRGSEGYEGYVTLTKKTEDGKGDQKVQIQGSVQASDQVFKELIAKGKKYVSSEEE